MIRKPRGVRVAHVCVDVTTARLNKIAELFDSRKLVTDVGTVLPLEKTATLTRCSEAPHKRDKIVLSMTA